MAVATLAGCADAAGPEGGSDIRFLRGDGQADTVAAPLSQGLIVEVRGEDGAPAAGLVVRFEPTVIENHPGYGRLPTTVVARLDEDTYGTLAVDTTDGRGEAAALVRLGIVAGPVTLVVSVPELGLVDTARFTVLPGSAAALEVTPEDTALFVGATERLRGFALDRFRNRRNDPVTYTLAAGGATVSDSGVVVGSAISRVTIACRSGPFRDTARVSVVPQGELAAILKGAVLDTPGVMLANLDGSGARRIVARLADPGSGLFWHPSGTRLVFHRDYEGVFTVDLQGTVEPALGTGTVTGATWPVYSRDGAWIYFGLSNGSALWRVGSDGASLTQLPLSIDGSGYDVEPTSSPDGLRVAYASSRPNGGTYRLRVLDLPSGAMTQLGAAGLFPRWSPVSEEIAFVSGDVLKTVRSDGSAERVVANVGSGGAEPFNWSGDGRWLIGNGSSGIVLVEVSTGLVLPLAWARNYRYPALRP